MRSNASNILLWQNSDKETLKCYEELSAGLTRTDWYELFNYATRQPYGFLHINLQQKLLDGRFCLGFSKVLAPDAWEKYGTLPGQDANEKTTEIKKDDELSGGSGVRSAEEAGGNDL